MSGPSDSGWGSGRKPGPGAASSPKLLLRRLRQSLAAPGDGQQRLDQIVTLIAHSMGAEVCSVYLIRGQDTLQLSATEGLRTEAVHEARLKIGEGLVGVIARDGRPVVTAKAREHPEFRYLPETGEERFSSFLGVPIQKLGRTLGVLVVQNERPMSYTEEESEALALVAMVIAEMAEAGTLIPRPSEDGESDEREPIHIQGQGAADGVAIGPAYLHEPKLLLPNPIAEDPAHERTRLHDALMRLRADIDAMLNDDEMDESGEHREVLETYALFANDRGWVRKLQEFIVSGLTAEAAVDAARTEARLKLGNASDQYLRQRFDDMDDIAQRLMRRLILPDVDRAMPESGAILVARALGPGEMMDYPRGTLAGVVLEDGAIGSHAAIVARAMEIPLIVQAKGVQRATETGDMMIVNGDQGHVHLRPREDVVTAYQEKLSLRAQEKASFAALRDRPCRSLDGHDIRLYMNGGLAADLPSLGESGAEGVGLLRTELHFMLNRTMPTREDQASFYSHILDKAEDRIVNFRTLDIGSDKVLPYMKQPRENNPALGWRAIRVGLDRPVVLRMQLQALLRAGSGRSLRVMFPMVAALAEFEKARGMLLEEVEKLDSVPPPSDLKIGTMLETPSLAFAPQRFFELTDFISIGGNDLMQFFFAADRTNERTAGRYEVTHPAFFALIRMIVERCAEADTELSFCGEAAGRPLDALALAAMGIRAFSMRPASIGPVKRAILAADLGALRSIADEAELARMRVRDALIEHCYESMIPI